MIPADIKKELFRLILENFETEEVFKTVGKYSLDQDFEKILKRHCSKQLGSSIDKIVSHTGVELNRLFPNINNPKLKANQTL